jgi:type II secretory pathway pseudopilin PulG
MMSGCQKFSMKLNTKDSSRAKNPSAFTSIELLIVIAVLTMLTAILLPALASTKEKDFRVTCMNNEKQLYTSLHIYSEDNGDLLPLFQGAGSWVWDTPTSVTTAILKNGCTKKMFYCPSTAPRFTDKENWTAANSLWNFGPGTFSIVGYAFSFSGSSSRINVLYQNRIIRTETHTGAPAVFTDNPATRELLADVIISLGSSLPASSADNFSFVFSGFTQNGVAYPHLSAHLRTGGVPSGGNIAFKDGHVQWRKFDASNSSATANNTKVRTGANSPSFWW